MNDTWNRQLVRWLVERLDAALPDSLDEIAAARLIEDIGPPLPFDVRSRVREVIRGSR